MSKTPRPKKKKSFYECANYEFDYDDLGKNYWCHAHAFGERECICDRVWSMQYCPCFKKGRLVGKFEVTKYDIECAENFKQEIKNRAQRIEDSERALYERLKQKYG